MSLKLEETIKKLQAYGASPYPILSVYLDFSQQDVFSQDELVEKFASLVNTHLDPNQKKSFAEDLLYIKEYLKNTFAMGKNQKGVALFAANDHFFEVVNLDFAVKSSLTVSHQPILDPIINSLNYFKRYVVILADREKGKVFTIHMGGVELEENISSRKEELPHKVHPQGAKDHSISRHIRMHLQKHIRYIISQTESLLKNRAISGVIIGGHKEYLNDIRALLPQKFKQKVVGEFVSELNIPLPQIAQKSLDIIGSINPGIRGEGIYSNGQILAE